VRPRTLGLVLLGLLLGLAQIPAACADPATPAQDEVNYLLTTMGESGCEFYRNGSWYNARAAEAHLRAKYSRFASGNQAGTAEEFIDHAATTSSLSGLAYAVRCGTSPTISSNSWLHELLAHYRAGRTPGAPRIDRGAPAMQAKSLNQ
jgi:Family of unknown function (DUF5329)